MHIQCPRPASQRRWLLPLLMIVALAAPLSLLATPKTSISAAGTQATTDLTWQQVHVSEGVYWYTLAFPTDRVGYVTGGPDWNVNGGAGQATIAKTTDGGLTWQTAKVDRTQYFMRGLACKDANTCWLSGGSSPRIRRTVDGGQTWLDAYDRYGYRGWTWAAGYTGKDNTALVATTGYFTYNPDDPSSAKREANYLRSTDGVSFDAVVSDGNGLVQWDFACPSPGVCYTPSKGRAYVTTNDGVSWTRRSAPGSFSDDYFYGIDCIDNNTCWMVGRPGRILVTYNGGASWQHANVSFTTALPRFWHVDMVDGQHGYAVGCDNVTPKPSNETDPPENVCLNGQGMIYRTDDGTNWYRIPSPTTADIMDVHAFNMDEVVIVDWSGKIWRSMAQPTPTPTQTPSPTPTNTPTPAVGTIAGIVFEDLNQDLLYTEDEPALPGAVLVLMQGPIERYSATSGADGRFVLSDIQPGQYTLKQKTAPPDLNGKAGDAPKVFALADTMVTLRIDAGQTVNSYVPQTVAMPPTPTPTPLVFYCGYLPMITMEP